MRRGCLLYGALLLWAFRALPATADSCVWFADEHAIHQVQADSITLTIPLREPRQLAMNAGDCGVWALSGEGRTLRHFADTGALVQEIRLQDLDRRLDEVLEIALDPYDDSLWLADERRLVHVSSSGQLLASVRAPGKIRDFRIALDQSLWLLGQRELWHLDRQGGLLGAFALGRQGDSESDEEEAKIRHLEIDSVAGLIWLAGKKQIIQAQLSALGTPVQVFAPPEEIEAFTLDPLSGNVWVAQGHSLVAFGRDGRLVASVDLRALGLRKPELLAFDPASRSLWVASKGTLSRFTSDTGQLIASLPARDADEALGVPAFRVDPTLALVRPPQNALTNNPLSQFTLAYDAQCNASPCGFGADYLGRYSLSATLNGQSVGSLFVFDPTTRQANFTPATRLPEGQNVFDAIVRDPFGHDSGRITNRFTVDTIPPKFLAITPAGGSTFSTPNILIQGTIDDPTATVVLAGLGLSQVGATFGFPVALRPGLNAFTLSATDPAGNVASASLHLTLATVSVTITSPINGATINDSSVAVSGTFQGPVNTGIAVNGVIAAQDGDRFFAMVPLQPGANILTAIATTPDGQTVTQTVSVTSTGPAPTRVSASVFQGPPPLTVTFTIVSDRPIQSVEGNFAVGFQSCSTSEEGTFCFEPGPFSISPVTGPLSFTYEQPGVYEARFNVTHTDGTVVTKTVSIFVQDLDQQLQQVWNTVIMALARRDTTQALQYFNMQAQAKYGPVLSALQPFLPEIVASFAPIQLSTFLGGIAEYAVKRTNALGVTNLYLIYFVQDNDGVWRLDTM